MKNTPFISVNGYIQINNQETIDNLLDMKFSIEVLFYILIELFTRKYVKFEHDFKCSVK